MDQRQIYQRGALAIENHPGERREKDQQDEEPAQPIEVWPRMGNLRDDQHQHA